MDEDDGDQTPPIFDLPTNGLDFDDFHSNPLTFRDALDAFTSIVPGPSDSDIDSENTIVDDADVVLETSSHEAGGSEVGGTAGNGAGSGVSATNGFASHGINGTGSGVLATNGVASHGVNGTGSGIPVTNGFASHGVHVDQSDGSDKKMEEEGTQPLT